MTQLQNIATAEIKLTEAEIQAAINVLKSGALRQGKECQAFEDEFAQKMDAEYAVTCANGSAALHLAYMTCLRPGDEVLVPSFTFISTASMVTMSAGRPVICDVDPETFLLDLEDAEKKITPRTRAVAPVHLFGNPCNADAVYAFAKEYGLFIVWDAAQAHGATFKDQNIGTFDDFVCYSFYPSKNMFVGEGGMICTNNQDFDHKLRYMRTHGQTGKYYHTMIGLNYRMTDVEAAIGREQLKRLDEMLRVRNRNAGILSKGLAEVPGICPQKVAINSQHAWHQYCIVVQPESFGCTRDELSNRVKERGIGTGIHYPRGLHQQPVFEERYGKIALPNTEYLAENILALPVHHGLSEADVERIVEVISDVRQ